MRMTFMRKFVLGLASTSAVALAVGMVTADFNAFSGKLSWAAAAQSHGGGGQGGSQGGGGHDDGGHEDGGHDDGGHDDGGHEDGGHSGGSGQGGKQGAGGQGPGDSGQRFGQGSSGGGNSGTRPPWAQEGIPEVELGRLNVVRSPSRVLDRALAEAIATVASTPGMSDFYSQSLDQAILQLSTEFDSLSYIDSPLQNLALFKDVLDGSTSLPGATASPGTLAAIFLGTASDKTIPISVDTVKAVTTILGTPVSDGTAATLAAQAEAVRIAILAGHG